MLLLSIFDFDEEFRGDPNSQFSSGKISIPATEGGAEGGGGPGGIRGTETTPPPGGWAYRSPVAGSQWEPCRSVGSIVRHSEDAENIDSWRYPLGKFSGGEGWGVVSGPDPTDVVSPSPEVARGHCSTDAVR